MLELFVIYVVTKICFQIPVIRRAMQLSSRGVSLIASAWSGPTWMKSNNAITPGYILPKYYQLWTDYMIR